jgi:hypothetical protein
MFVLGGEPLPAAPSVDSVDSGSLERLGHLILQVITTRRVGVVAMLVIAVFTIVVRRTKSRWPRQTEVLKFALAMLGLPTATSIFAALVLLPPQIPGVSEDSLVAAGLVGTIVVLIESCSTILNLFTKHGADGGAGEKLKRKPLEILDVALEPTTDTYKNKLRVVLENTTTETITVRAPRWMPRPGDVAVHAPMKGTLQPEIPGAWQVGDFGTWGAEATEMSVAPGQIFRTWMGLDHGLTLADFRRRHETQRVGTLVLPLVIDGKDAAQEIRV